MAVVFTLAGPLASWGGAAGTTRGTARTPSWSGIVGLLGAALGYQRGDGRLVELSRDYAMAVRVDRDGGEIVDYHTVEAPLLSAAQLAGHGRPTTRREELAGKTTTVITRRHYRQDVEYACAVVPLVGAPCVTEVELLEALWRPRWPLVMGRRACLVSMPPCPRVVSEGTVSALLGTERVCYDSRLDGGDCCPHHRLTRHDWLVGDREFASREEYVC